MQKASWLEVLSAPPPSGLSGGSHSENGKVFVKKSPLKLIDALLLRVSYELVK